MPLQPDVTDSNGESNLGNYSLGWDACLSQGAFHYFLRLPKQQYVGTHLKAPIE